MTDKITDLSSQTQYVLSLRVTSGVETIEIVNSNHTNKKEVGETNGRKEIFDFSSEEIDTHGLRHLASGLQHLCNGGDERDRRRHTRKPIDSAGLTQSSAVGNEPAEEKVELARLNGQLTHALDEETVHLKTRQTRYRRLFFALSHRRKVMQEVVVIHAQSRVARFKFTCVEEQ